MKLSKICEEIEYTLLQGSLETEVRDIIYDSRKIAPETMFVCMVGAVTDGHKYIPDAVEKGASVIVLEKEEEAAQIPENITVLKVESARLALALMSAALFDHPARKLVTIGLTGTKGKTTTTYMIKKVLEMAGKKVGLIGTIGYSVRNLKYMAKFAETYPDRKFVQTVSAQIPWSHNIAILEKVKDPQQRIWYIEKTAENGWSHNVLIHQIESSLYERQVLADKVTNFEHRLPSPQSELAVQTMKDPYVFDFIPFRENMLERDIEQALVRDVTKLLLELGTGFAFLGNQYPLNVGGDDFYIDLLFYNLNLRCYVVIELKTGDFKPEYAGQLNFYLSAVDGILKKEQDNPSIGLLLCKSKNNVVAEYSLKDISKPIGVSEYKITSSLPDDLEKQLPSVEDIQKRIK